MFLWCFPQLEALRLLSPSQAAELLLLPGLSPEPQREVIQAVFSHITADTALARRFQEVLSHLVVLSGQVISSAVLESRAGRAGGSIPQRP